MNTDWKKLKQSKDGIPTYDSLIPYILKVLENGEETTTSTISKKAIQFLKIPDEIQNIKYPKYPNSDGVLVNRFSFALSDLFKADAVARPNRGIYEITDSGISLLNEYGDQLNKKVLKKQPAYIKYMQEMNERNKLAGLNETDELFAEEDEINPRKKIDELATNLNNEVATELLNKIRNSDPYFFERLVVDLLVAMGYSGENGTAKVTSKSNDGGIDGVINQDPLGTSTVYIQAKRYKETNVVQRNDIQSFYGALAGVNADRGVFITTSKFSKGAMEFAKNQGIVLIDGIQLTDLMIDYQVGVETAKTYKVFKIDSDYFDFE